MPTFETLFKAWSSQMTDHVKELREDLKEAKQGILDKNSLCETKVGELNKRVDAIEKQLFEMKTLSKTRIAVMSAVIAFIVTITALAVNFIKIKDAVKTEIINTVK